MPICGNKEKGFKKIKRIIKEQNEMTLEQFDKYFLRIIKLKERYDKSINKNQRSGGASR